MGFDWWLIYPESPLYGNFVQRICMLAEYIKAEANLLIIAMYLVGFIYINMSRKSI